MSTVEVVILTPVLIVFVVAMVQLGLYAENVSQVQNAAQDAARMGSVQRTSAMAHREFLLLTRLAECRTHLRTIE